jgi:hypothetical protein
MLSAKQDAAIPTETPNALCFWLIKNNDGPLAYHQLITHRVIIIAPYIKETMGTDPTSGTETIGLLLEDTFFTALKHLLETSANHTLFRGTMGFRRWLSGVPQIQGLHNDVGTHNWNNLKFISLHACPTLCIIGARFFSVLTTNNNRWSFKKIFKYTVFKKSMY